MGGAPLPRHKINATKCTALVDEALNYAQLVLHKVTEAAGGAWIRLGVHASMRLIAPCQGAPRRAA